MAVNPSRTISFLHTADVHLGRPFDSLGSRAEERRGDIRGAFRKMVDRAVQDSIDLFLVAGDLFDSPCPPPADREAAREGFRRLQGAGVRAFAIPGNHDCFIPGGVWTELESVGVHVFSRPALQKVSLVDRPVDVFGTAYDEKHPERRPIADLAFDDSPAQRSRIFLLHGSLDVIGEGYVEAPFSEEEIARLPFDYVALGHYHRFRETGGRPLAAYPGSPVGLRVHPSEAGERTYVSGELEILEGRTEVRIQPETTGGRLIHILDVDLSQCADPESLLTEIRGAASPDALVGVRLRGAPSLEVWECSQRLEERFSGSFFHFRVDWSGISVPGDIPDDDRYILGRFCNKLLADIEQAEGEEKVVNELALRLGMAAAERAKAGSGLPPASTS